MTIALLFVVAYLLGSIPTAVWVGKAFYDIDIRHHGSKNAGATNTFRVLGKPAGFAVFLIDVAKGYTAVWLVDLYFVSQDMSEISTVKVVSAICAVLGHIFPVFAGFKGGKGVATAFGILLALTLQTALICFGVFLLVWLLSNFVSLGSITAAFSYPWVQWYLNPYQDDVLMIFTIILSLSVILSHHRNIRRLFAGSETKTYAFRKEPNKKS